jgi:hypothetical protein
MTQLVLDGQLTFAHPAIVGRERLRMFADASMLAEVKRRDRTTRARSIVFGRRERPFNWFLCLVCNPAGPMLVAQWSSSTNPAPKWAQERKRAHWAQHCDAWLASKGYVVPGADSAVDLVLGDTLVEAFSRIGGAA